MTRTCCKEVTVETGKYPNISADELLRRLLDAGMDDEWAIDAGVLWRCEYDPTCDCCQGDCDVVDCDHDCECPGDECGAGNAEADEKCCECGSLKP